jgi:hypothetical protein
MFPFISGNAHLTTSFGCLQGVASVWLFLSCYMVYHVTGSFPSVMARE